METTKLDKLIRRAMQHTLTPGEQETLLEYLADPKNRQQAEKLLARSWNDFAPSDPVFSKDQGEQILRRILTDGQHIREIPKNKSAQNKVPFRTILAVASVVLIVMISFYFIKEKRQTTALTLAEAVEHYDIEPGKDQAIITLGDGRKVLLNEAADGVIAEESGIGIYKSTDGQISYRTSASEHQMPIVYNTITVPKGGQYRLILADGTKVHLNSETTLRYPTRFSGEQRHVQLEGEAYFEVEHLEGHIPFIVATSSQEVEVLGTVFNVNAYPSSTVRTTLLQGKVRVSNNKGTSALLNPGESAVLGEGQANFTVGQADLENELAWHNGYFMFNEESINNIMERVARWYNVDIEYRGDTRNLQFGGIFQRSKSIIQLLENFRSTGLVDFKIEGRKIIVMEKK